MNLLTNPGFWLLVFALAVVAICMVVAWVQCRDAR